MWTLKRITQILTGPPAFSGMETAEEARVRYKTAWRKYRRLRLEFPLSIPGWFVFSELLGAIFRLFDLNQHVAMVFILAYVPYMSFLGCQWMYWQCPRCGKSFKGRSPFYPKCCYYCGLPKWAEPPDN